MMNRKAQNIMVILAACGMLLLLVATQTYWLASPDSTEPEQARCFGLALVTANRCRTDTSACHTATLTPRDATSWLMLPATLCTKLGGKVGTP